MSLDLKGFKAELQALLIKYNVSIEFRCDDCSDWYGMIDRRMSVIDNKTFEETRLVNDCEISAGDIKQE